MTPAMEAEKKTLAAVVPVGLSSNLASHFLHLHELKRFLCKDDLHSFYNYAEDITANERVTIHKKIFNMCICVR